jgi:hypothetical protein
MENSSEVQAQQGSQPKASPHHWSFTNVQMAKKTV